MQRGVSHCTPTVRGASGDDVARAPTPGMDAAAAAAANKEDRPERMFKRAVTGPVGKVARRRSNSNIGLAQPTRAKSFGHPQDSPSALSRRGATLRSATLRSAAVRSATLPASTPPPPWRPPPPAGSVRRTQLPDTPRTALIRELSSRHQSMVPFRSQRESQLI
ncbi:hypothetical protein CRUP_019189 [Coryphaenoides rupestris]|nr:hypothetical protein CRUP_019189 [Coryphaenoides rupestris]